MNRNTRVDVARGFLMLYIIAVIHGIYWLQLIGGSARSILLFEMPCIFFLSGYSYSLAQAAGVQINSVRRYCEYLLQRAVRILVPYWFYAIACLCVLFVKGDPQQFGTPELKLSALTSWLNPLSYGRNYSMGELRGHLWFIPPFLAVTSLLPLVSKLSFRTAPPTLMLVAFFCAIAWADYFFSDMARTILTYGIWALIGYVANKKMVDSSEVDPRWGAAILLLCISALSLNWYFNLGTMDMQSNKFPPNATFFLFSVAWMLVIMFAAPSVSDALVARLSKSRILQPFIKSGYSLYLWQGLGYTIAGYLGAKFALPSVGIWAIAVIATVGMGMLAAPMESFRLRQGGKNPPVARDGSNEAASQALGRPHSDNAAVPSPMKRFDSTP